MIKDNLNTLGDNTSVHRKDPKYNIKDQQLQILQMRKYKKKKKGNKKPGLNIPVKNEVDEKPVINTPVEQDIPAENFYIGSKHNIKSNWDKLSKAIIQINDLMNKVKVVEVTTHDDPGSEGANPLC